MLPLLSPLLLLVLICLLPLNSTSHHCHYPCSLSSPLLPLAFFYSLSPRCCRGCLCKHIWQCYCNLLLLPLPLLLLSSKNLLLLLPPLLLLSSKSNNLCAIKDIILVIIAAATTSVDLFAIKRQTRIITDKNPVDVQKIKKVKTPISLIVVCIAKWNYGCSEWKKVFFVHHHQQNSKVIRAKGLFLISHAWLLITNHSQQAFIWIAGIIRRFNKTGRRTYHGQGEYNLFHSFYNKILQYDPMDRKKQILVMIKYLPVINTVLFKSNGFSHYYIQNHGKTSICWSVQQWAVVWWLNYFPQQVSSSSCGCLTGCIQKH